MYDKPGGQIKDKKILKNILYILEEILDILNKILEVNHKSCGGT